MKYLKTYEFLGVNIPDGASLRSKFREIIGDKYSYDLSCGWIGDSVDVSVLSFRSTSDGKLKNIPNHILYKLKAELDCNRVEIRIRKNEGEK
jgi:hypothetical protein